MLYHLFEWFKEQEIKFPGSGLFQFITFRVIAGYAVVIGYFNGVWKETDQFWL